VGWLAVRPVTNSGVVFCSSLARNEFVHGIRLAVPSRFAESTAQAGRMLSPCGARVWGGGGVGVWGAVGWWVEMSTECTAAGGVLSCQKGGGGGCGVECENEVATTNRSPWGRQA